MLQNRLRQSCARSESVGESVMKKLVTGISALGLMFGLLFGAAATASAQAPNQKEVRDTLRSLNSKIDDLNYTLMFQLRSSSADADVSNDAARSIEVMKAATRSYESNLDLRRENRNDVSTIIAAAQDMNAFFVANPQNRRIETVWNDIRDLVGRLSSSYGLTPNWSGRTSNASQTVSYGNTRNLPQAPITSSILTGTYRLDTGRSENAADVIRGVRVNETQRQDLKNKLDAPEELAISVRGDQVTLASSNAAPISFPADGRERTEMSNGRNLRVRATLRGNDLTISSLGGETDYTLTFLPDGNGRGLKVTRRITTEYLSETIFSDSYYTKSSEIAGLGINDDYAGNDDGYSGNDIPTSSDDTAYSTNDPNAPVGGNLPNPTLSQPRIGRFLIPNGAIVSASLENEINTKVSQNNDRFKMTVQSPMEFRGAVIEGYLSGVGRSGQVSGRPNVTFNFERITLRDGTAYDFGGFVQSVKDHTGKDIRVDGEGTAQGDSQTRETAKRGGIGAGLGAIIGAIAGGGKGAVLGAIIGGGAGAGSVAIMGRDDIRLMPGSTITVQSSSPVRNDQPNDN